MKSLIFSKTKLWNVDIKNLMKAVDLFKAQFKKNQEHPSEARQGLVLVIQAFDQDQKDQLFKAVFDKLALTWEKKTSAKTFAMDTLYFQSEWGPVWLCSPGKIATKFFSDSQWTWAKEAFGSLLGHFKLHKLKRVYVYTGEEKKSVVMPALVGLEMAFYQFKNFQNIDANELPEIFFDQLTKDDVKEAQAIATSINLARHLVNTPPNQMAPQDFVQYARSLKWGKNVKVEVWDQRRLKKEKMNLHLAVGQGSENSPYLVHIRYSRRGNKKSVAFVGKGITFDTGGLDIKPASGMRLMKKDMGGAASILGLAHYISQHDWTVDFDFYMALAENSISGNAFRPSDVIQSRAGYLVEIDNTDAEGRLVLADALDLATKDNAKLDCVINVATLTGAIKVALGADVAGLFTNDDQLADELMAAGRRTGDHCWRMPLVDKYFSSLNSSFADFKNSSEGFGGAITAALFLQKFVNQKKWAHLDIYAWNDKPTGSLSFAGGSGQGVALLIDFVTKYRA
ncbi:MAG: leucyl aminopeptidase family protein [Bdellovibrionaceae bacterium]|nr:leucyl aminopeptidase family protein [Pseudobdellovibrionaceae bacterium]